MNGRDKDKIAAVIEAARSVGGEGVGAAADLTDFAAIEGMPYRLEERGP